MFGAVAVVLLGLVQPETPPATETSHGEEATHAATEQLEAFEHNRFVVERAIDASMLLTSTQKGVLQAITRHLNQETGTAWPSYATIAHKAGYERSTVIDAIAELEQLGWIDKEVRRGDDGWHQSNLYRVRIPVFDAEAFAEAERVRGRRRERVRPVAVTASPTPSRAESMKSSPTPIAEPLMTKQEVELSKLNADQRAVLQALKSRDELRSVATPEQAVAIWQIATNFQKDRATTLSAVLDVANKAPAMGAQSPEKLLGRITSFVAAARPAATPSTGPDVMAEYRELLRREAEAEREFNQQRATASGPRRPLRVDWPPKPA